MLEKLPGVHLVNEVIKKKAKKDGGRSAPQGLSGWAKAQMMMIYAVEHDEIWVHKGFLQVSLLQLMTHSQRYNERWVHQAFCRSFRPNPKAYISCA